MLGQVKYMIDERVLIATLMAVGSSATAAVFFVFLCRVGLSEMLQFLGAFSSTVVIR